MDDTISKNLRDSEEKRPDVRPGIIPGRNQRPIVAKPPENIPGPEPTVVPMAEHAGSMFTVTQSVMTEIRENTSYVQGHSGQPDIMVEIVPTSAVGVFVRCLKDMLKPGGRMYFKQAIVPAIGNVPSVYGLKKVTSDIGSCVCWMKPVES